MAINYSEQQIQDTITFWTKNISEVEIRDDRIHIKPKCLPQYTKNEIQWLKNTLGVTDDFQDAGWILPDGSMLQMNRTEEVWFVDDEMRDAAGKPILDPKRYEHETLPIPPTFNERANTDQLWIADYLNMGFVRIDGAESALVHIGKNKPTSAQMNRLYDFADTDWSTKYNFFKHKRGITKFLLSVNGTVYLYDDQDEFCKRLMNDIRNAF